MVSRDSMNIARRRRASGLPERGSAAQSRLLLLALVALGAFLRFHRLDVQSLWVDELLTIGAAEIGGRLGLREFFGNVQGPLHALIIHAVARVSSSAAALRGVSAVAGIASIPAFYLLGKALVDRRTGLVAALLVTVSPFAIWYSQELRNYSFLILLSAAATLLAWRLITEKRRSWVSYVVVVTLALYSNLSAAFLCLSHAVFAAQRALLDRRFLPRAALAFAAIVVLAAPIAWGLSAWVAKEEITEQATFTPGADAAELRRGRMTFVPMAVPYSVFSMGYGFSLGPGVRELHVEDAGSAFRDSAPFTVPAGIALALALLLGLRRLSRVRRGLTFALLVMMVPLACVCALALANVKPINPRYLTVAYPMLVVTGAAGVTALRRPLGALLCVVIIVFCGVSLRGHYLNPRYWKEDVRASAYYVQVHEEPGDVVLVPIVRDVFNHYYDGGAERTLFYRGQAGSDDAVARRMAQQTRGARRLWHVEARPWDVDPEGRIRAYLDARYEVIDEAEFTGVSLVLYALD